MRKQLRSSDILFREYNINILIKDVKDIIVERRDNVVIAHLLVTIILLNNTTYSQRIRLNVDYFQNDLNEYVRAANSFLKEYRNANND